MKRFSNILLLADEGLENSIAFKRAVELASSNQATLTLIDVVESVPAEMQLAIAAVTPGEILRVTVDEKQEQLEGLAKVGQRKGINIETDVLVGKPFIEIIRKVLRDKHDLVIKCSSPSESLKDMLFGGTDMRLLRKCPCPVWIVKATEPTRYRRMIAAVGRDPDDAGNDALNRQILEMATSLALAEASELHVVHAWDLEHESLLRSPRSGVPNFQVDSMAAEERVRSKAWLENLVSKHSTNVDKNAVNYLPPQLHVERGVAGDIVSNKAKELGADLVVMGTVSRTGIPGFLMGNTAETILNQIDCSVLTIKPSGFVSPVGP